MIPREDLRPLLHGGTGLLALLLGFLPRSLDLVGAGLGVLAGWVVFPRTPLEAVLRREGEPFVGGLRTYPVAVFGLVLLLPETLAACAWGILAFGDAAASLVGRRVRAPRLFGHRKATVSGTLAFVLVGGGGGAAVASFVAATGGGPAVTASAAALAALAAAAADMAPVPPDDNLPIAATAGVVLAACGGLFG